MNTSDDCSSNIHEFCGRCECPCHGITIDYETGIELLVILAPTFVNYEYERVHELIKKLYELERK